MKISVLIVDDEFGLADVTADLLQDAGYDVAIAINGKLGLASLAVRRADIVIVDLMMPVMDGPEMIRRMRADAALATIPTILMTALPEAIPTGAAAMHDVAMIKPFSLAELLRTMNRLLHPT
ncbi:MAG: response regulator [Deltaproteobacteria bacterium]|nr:response regulator [Deltaproteobacteria bacterium]